MSVQRISTNQGRARRLTPQHKLQILKEWEATATGRDCPEVSSPSLNLVSLEKALEQGAQIFLSGTKPKVDPRIRRLEKENQKLKEALALQTRN